MLFPSALPFSGILRASGRPRVSLLMFIKVKSHFQPFLVTSDFHYTYWSVEDKTTTTTTNRSHLISRQVLEKKKKELSLDIFGRRKRLLILPVAFLFIKLSPILCVLKAIRVSSSFPQSQYVLGIFSKMGLRHSVTFVEVCRI